MKHTALAIFALIACADAHSQAFRCLVDGKTTFQDQPCTTGTQNAVALTEKSPNDYDAEYERYRLIAAEALKICKPGSDHCKAAQTALDSIEGGKKISQLMREAARADMDRDAAKTNARINHQIAKDDYDRAAALLDQSTGSQHFNSALAARSNAHGRLMNARSEYYRVYKRFPAD